MIISKKALELANQLREKRKAKKTAKVEEKPREIKLDPRFPAQNALINDTSRYIVAQCSRRAGKTNGIAIRFFKTMAKYPNSQCLYLSLTRESAQEILWPVLIELNERFNLGCTFIPSKLTMVHPNGSKLVLFGADMKNFIKRLKGRKYPGIAVDEAQDFGGHLQSLIDDVLTPSISDYADGWLLLTGTPGPVPQGYFFQITQERRFGYSYHGWTLLENPYMPDPAGFIADIKQKREWTDDNPTLKREWLNQWVLDVDALWIKYKEAVNHFDALPENYIDKMKFILGIDIGFKDADAFAVIGWEENSNIIYLVEESVMPKQGITELVTQAQALVAKYKPIKMIMDEGGLGKKIAEEMRRRHAIPVHPADKARKQENVELINDYLRLGKFKAQKHTRFAQDSYLIQIDWDKSTPDKIVVKKKPHSDIIDSVLYAFKESPAWTNVAQAGPPKWGTPEWFAAEKVRMWEAAQEHFSEKLEEERRAAGLGYED